MSDKLMSRPWPRPCLTFPTALRGGRGHSLLARKLQAMSNYPLWTINSG